MDRWSCGGQDRDQADLPTHVASSPALLCSHRCCEEGAQAGAWSPHVSISRFLKMTALLGAPCPLRPSGYMCQSQLCVVRQVALGTEAESSCLSPQRLLHHRGSQGKCLESCHRLSARLVSLAWWAFPLPYSSQSGPSHKLNFTEKGEGFHVPPQQVHLLFCMQK